MRLTTKGRYAVTAMLDLALHSEPLKGGQKDGQKDGQEKGVAVSLADISKRQEISLSYLEQLFAKLRKHGLVCSVRGPGGGYKLSRPLPDVSVAQIIDAVDESLDATLCGGAGDCQQGEVCLTHYLWADLSSQIHNFLHGISLASLVERRDVQAVLQRQNQREQSTATDQTVIPSANVS